MAGDVGRKYAQGGEGWKENFFVIICFCMIVPIMKVDGREDCPPQSARVYVFRLHPGDDLLLKLEKFVSTHRLSSAIVLTTAGSLASVRLRMANQHKPVFLPQGHYEIVSLVGTLGPEGSHLHMSVSNEHGETFGGHLVQGNLVYTTAEVAIATMKHCIFHRKMADSGYRELAVECR